MTTTRTLSAVAAACLVAVLQPRAIDADDGERSLRLDHYVAVQSSVPSIKGQAAQIYVRERVKAGTVLRGTSLADRVVLFVHGAGTPGAVAFDPSYEGYSWMAYLADAGFDVFAMDFTGYGRSTRPPAMNEASSSWCSASASETGSSPHGPSSTTGPDRRATYIVAPASGSASMRAGPTTASPAGATP